MSVNVQAMKKIAQIFVAFSEKLNFTYPCVMANFSASLFETANINRFSFPVQQNELIKVNESRKQIMKSNYSILSVSFVFWKNPGLHNLLSRFTDLQRL